MKKNGRTLLDDIKLIHRGMNEFEIFLPGQHKLFRCRHGKSLLGL